MKHIILFLVLVSLSACSTIPPEYGKGENKCCVRTLTSKEGVGLLISRIDDGERLMQHDPKMAWILSNEHNIPTKVWLTPGSHKLVLMTSQHVGYNMYEYAEHIRHSTVVLDVEVGTSYELKAKPAESTNESCDIYVNSVPTSKLAKTGRERNWVKLSAISTQQ